MKPSDINTNLVAKRINANWDNDEPPSMKADTIMLAVCDACGISRGDMLAPGRPEAIAIPRMLSMALCRTLEGLTDDANALLHGRTHRTTVYHAVGRMSTQAEQVEQHLKSLNNNQKQK